MEKLLEEVQQLDKELTTARKILDEARSAHSSVYNSYEEKRKELGEAISLYKVPFFLRESTGKVFEFTEVIATGCDYETNTCQVNYYGKEKARKGVTTYSRNFSEKSITEGIAKGQYKIVTDVLDKHTLPKRGVVKGMQNITIKGQEKLLLTISGNYWIVNNPFTNSYELRNAGSTEVLYDKLLERKPLVTATGYTDRYRLHYKHNDYSKSKSDIYIEQFFKNEIDLYAYLHSVNEV